MTRARKSFARIMACFSPRKIVRSAAIWCFSPRPFRAAQLAASPISSRVVPLLRRAQGIPGARKCNAKNREDAEPRAAGNARGIEPIGFDLQQLFVEALNLLR